MRACAWHDPCWNSCKRAVDPGSLSPWTRAHRQGVRADDSCHMFKLLRYFSLTSFVSVVIVAAILGVFYRELAVHSLVDDGRIQQSRDHAGAGQFAVADADALPRDRGHAADRAARSSTRTAKRSPRAGDASARADGGQGQGLRHERPHGLLDRARSRSARTRAATPDFRQRASAASRASSRIATSSAPSTG